MVKCKKHPKHKQSPGVCSLCLSEKLSRVSSTTRTRFPGSRALAYYCSSSSISSSEDESSYPSSSASPMHHNEEIHHPRNFSNNVNNVVNFFGKSKSMNFGGSFNNKKKIVGGFWSKFVRPRRNGHHLKHGNDITKYNDDNNNNNNNQVYMSQPFVASSSNMVVC